MRGQLGPEKLRVFVKDEGASFGKADVLYKMEIIEHDKHSGLIVRLIITGYEMRCCDGVSQDEVVILIILGFPVSGKETYQANYIFICHHPLKPA